MPSADGGDAGADALSRMKTIALACLGRAVDRFGNEVGEQQEVLAWLSDLIITVFAVESGLLPGGTVRGVRI
jgi:hypothetical protein